MGVKSLYRKLTTEELARKAIKGDEDAFDLLYQRVLALVDKICEYRPFRDSEEVEDFKSYLDTFIMKTIKRYDPNRGCSFMTYITSAITYDLQNYYATLFRKKRKANASALSIEAIYEQIALMSKGCEQNDTAKGLYAEIVDKLTDYRDENERQFKELIEDIMQKLTRNQQEIFMLYFVWGYSADEVGDMLGKSGITITKTVQRIRNRLTKYYKELFTK